MLFNDHSKLAGSHAFLSASNYHWINYDDEKMALVFRNKQAAMHGTRLHAFAAECIALGQKLPRSTKTINQFVNDVVAYRMKSEQILFYSFNSYGTADAIDFKNNMLRIFDLKTGVEKSSFKQLLVYVALFCLEYAVDPSRIETDLRIYQNDDVLTYEPTLEEIVHIMEQITKFDRLLDQIRAEEL